MLMEGVCAGTQVTDWEIVFYEPAGPATRGITPTQQKQRRTVSHALSRETRSLLLTYGFLGYR
ncbi:hypothetical protein GCM10011588_19620 [Nocardia jinanensis]|uniref:Uncharacterized protein n=1 Tax=Nocardia jinanensis TaxID=382504 RepID=A0A917VQR8_9NOCA|nr:hypothetical protein GCM10011588_19620 [Nocardia jinanensis]